MTTYATPADVRTFYPGVNTDDVVVQAALDMGQVIVDNFTSSTFGTPLTSTKLFDDVRTRLLPLPTPFSNITAISVSGYDLAAGQWEVESWGVRLFPLMFKDASGLPMLNVFDYSLAGPWAQQGQSGFSVTVTATWGYAAVPLAVKRANILLALDDLSASSGIGSNVDTDVRSVSVEGFSVSLADPSLSLNKTTGNKAVDRLLAPYRRNLVGIG